MTDPPRQRFPLRRLLTLVGAAMGLGYVAFALFPPLRGGRGADGAEVALGLAILVPCLYMFARYHVD